MFCRAPQIWACCPLSRGGLASIPLRRPTFFSGDGTTIFWAEASLLKMEGSIELDPHGSYTGAMSYEHEPADPSSMNQSLHCCSSRKLLLPSLLALPVSPSLPAAHLKSLLRRSWRHCYLCGRYRPLAVVGPVLDVCRLGTRAQVTPRVCSAAAQILPSACRASSLVALSGSRMVNLQGARCIRSLPYPQSPCPVVSSLVVAYPPETSFASISLQP